MDVPLHPCMGQVEMKNPLRAGSQHPRPATGEVHSVYWCMYMGQVLFQQLEGFWGIRGLSVWAPEGRVLGFRDSCWIDFVSTDSYWEGSAHLCPSSGEPLS